jgi:hypothetical protein
MFTRHQNRPAWRLWLSAAVACAIALLVRHYTHATGTTLMAANVFEVVDWMMQESLDLLVNKNAIASMFNTEVQKEFEHDFAPGETVRVKYPQEYLIREGPCSTPARGSIAGTPRSAATRSSASTSTGTRSKRP